ncbi:MAG TPA: hypothetical protein VFH27_08735 [Longimicrobiaceae bacterium]|nr:hypothetical protein [Longimicrobiaceae bacterium]
MNNKHDVSTAPKPFVFVIMPFADEFKERYELGIRAACIEAGAHCERVDEQLFEESITERIYNQISKADIIVAELTGRNANVFYETGYAHALGKRTLLLANSVDDMPFDTRQLPHIVYNGDVMELKRQLLGKLVWALANRDTGRTPEPNIPSFYANGQLLNGAEIRVNDARAPTLAVQIDVHNETTQELSSVPVSVVTTSDFPVAYIGGALATIKALRTILPDGRILHSLGRTRTLLPEMWDQLLVKFERRIVKENRDPAGGTSREYVTGAHKLVVRGYTPAGPIDIPFTLEITE